MEKVKLFNLAVFGSFSSKSASFWGVLGVFCEVAVL